MNKKTTIHEFDPCYWGIDEVKKYKDYGKEKEMGKAQEANK